MATKLGFGPESTGVKVEHLPPSGPFYNPEYQKGFHYRGKLFCSSSKRINTLCRQASEESLYSAEEEQELCEFERPPSRASNRSEKTLKSSKPRRIQSAKGRLEKRQDEDSTDKLEKSGSQVSVFDINLNVDIPKQKLKRPSSASQCQYVKRDISPSKSSSRPSSAKLPLERQRPIGAENDDSVKPSVYGLKFKRQVFGKDPSTFSGSGPTKDSPYIFSKDADSIDKKEVKENIRPMPACLEPLRPWLTTDISSDVLGVNPETCLVFLSGCLNNLPEVPPPQGPDEPLPVQGQLNDKPPPHKKYAHPFFERMRLLEMEGRNRPLKKICTDDGTVIHARYEGRRTKDVVRKEIQELENLLKGIGSYDSECMMVQYQADITRLREMVDDTYAKMPDRIRNPPEPPDTFGLRKFCQEHDEIMLKIRQQHELCVQELAMLESGMELEETQRYFSLQSLQVHLPSPPS